MFDVYPGFPVPAEERDSSRTVIFSNSNGQWSWSSVGPSVESTKNSDARIVGTLRILRNWGKGPRLLHRGRGSAMSSRPSCSGMLLKRVLLNERERRRRRHILHLIQTSIRGTNAGRDNTRQPVEGHDILVLSTTTSMGFFTFSCRTPEEHLLPRGPLMPH